MNEIHKFDPVVYPFKLWVAITSDFKLLSDKFYQGYNKEEITDRSGKNEATTYMVQLKKPPTRYGALIIFHSKKYCNMGNVAHEATHAADYLLKHIHETSIGEEQYAYLVGWIAECIEKVKRGKV